MSSGEPSPATPAAGNRGCLSILVGAVVLALVCGGLLFGAATFSGYLESQDEWADRPGTPVPSPVASEPATISDGLVIPVNGIRGLEQVLANRVVLAAGVVKPTTSRCDTEDVRPDFTCKVTYDGEVVTYAVTVDMAFRKGGGPYEAKPDSMVLTREGVLAAVWRTYGTNTTNLRCPDGIPEKARVAPNTKLPQRCYFIPTNNHPSFRHDDDLRTREIEIIIGDRGINVALNHQ